jgi:hypothetical protein
MKKFIFTLLFSTLVFSSPSYAGWTEVEKNVVGSTSYVDFDRIRKHDGYVYYWVLSDLLKPSKSGVLSVKAYYQGDCKLFRLKYLSLSFYTEPMGNGTLTGSNNTPDKEWRYPPPSSSGETVLNSVCSH